MLLKIALAAGSLCLFAHSAVAAEAGKVVFVTGEVQVGGRAAMQDGAVQEGDRLTTGADGYVYVKTVDNGFLILRPNSAARVVAYSIDKNDPSKTQVKLELTKGVARAISGQGVQQAKQNFRFNTPVAAIGVRGTDFTVYTDQQTSRVSVVSGGVVMSGFGANCLAAGTGPCEGRNAKELFASQRGLLLQVDRNNNIPQVMQNPALAPDQTEKPRGDEPAAKQAAPSTPMTQVNLDPKRAQSIDKARPAPLPETVTPVVPEPVVVGPPVMVVEPVVPVTPAVPVIPVPVKPAVPEIFWGRWQAIAGKGVKLGRVGDADVELATYYGSYAITRLKNSALVMPKEGMAAFRLTNSEAIMTNAGGSRFATVEDGQLSMDFAKHTFDTVLTVKAGLDRAGVVGSGIITDKGMLYHDSRSETLIYGYLGGANAEQAGYIFRNTSTPGITVTGATLWNR